MASFSALINLSGLALLAISASAQTFAPVVTYPVGANSYPISIAAGDINSDGKPDLLTANYSAGTVGILLGNSNGTFQPVTTLNASSNTPCIAVSDVNNDGKLDLLTTFILLNGLAIVNLGNGNGTFSNATTYFTGISSSPQNIAAGDVNGDGKPDLLVANTGNSTAGVLLGNGNGTFQGVSTYFTGTNTKPMSIAVADLNGDGKPDLATANGSNSTVSVLLGNGNGTFQTATIYSAGPSSYPTCLVVADVNGDGQRDVLTANYYSDNIGVLLGNGNGSLQPVTTYTTGTGSNPNNIVVADANGDGRPDLFTANGGNSTAGVLLGNGNGSFLPIVTYITGSGSGPAGIAVADANGDGKPDIFVTNASANTACVLLNTTPLPTRAALPGTSTSLAPNPATTETVLTATNLPAATCTLDATLLNALGQRMRQLQLPATQGVARAPLPTAGLAPGLYLLRLTAADAQGQVLGALPTQHLEVH